MKKNRYFIAIHSITIIVIAAIIGFSFTALSLTGCDTSNDTTHTHQWGAWKSNATQHWKECSCGEEYGRANHNGNPCGVCSYSSGNSSGEYNAQGLLFTPINNNLAYEVSKGNSTATSIVIPSTFNSKPVTTIASNGFFSYSSLTSVTIPASVTIIYSMAFMECTSLTTVTFNSTISSSGFTAQAFDGDLREKYLAGGVGTYTRSAGSSTWTKQGGGNTGTSGLSFTLITNNTAYEVSRGSATAANIVIPATYNGLPVTRIASASVSGQNYSGAFVNFTAMTSITIPDSVTVIDLGAFRGCTNLTSITIPDSVIAIAHGAFYNTGIYNNTPNNSVVYADKWAVDFKGNLGNITLNQTTVGIASQIFLSRDIYAQINLTGITIPASVKRIGVRSFEGGGLMTYITVENGNTVFKSEGNCLIRISDNVLITGTINSTIPEGITRIENYAFYSRAELPSSIIIPSTVTSIGNSAFNGCINLTSVTIHAATPPALGSSVFNSNGSGRRIYVPAGSVSDYKAATNWSEYASSIYAIP